MIWYIIVAWLAFCAGFAFSFTTFGVQMGYALLQKLDEYLPKKKEENK